MSKAKQESDSTRDDSPVADGEPLDGEPAKPERPREIGGPKGPEPTRYGDWEKNGRCSDF